LFFIGTLAVGDQAYEILALYFPEKWLSVLAIIYVYARQFHAYFIQYVCLVFLWICARTFFGRKKFYFIFPLGAVLIHTGINYYFEDGMTLVEQGFSQAEVLAVLNGKGSNQIVPILNSPGFANFISAYMGTVVELQRPYHCSLCFYVSKC
jgi:hypothetical protein